MEPTPGGPLAQVLETMLLPDFVMVARLAKGPIGQPADTVLLADLVEADFPGYAPVTLTADTEEAWEQEGYGELSPQSAQFMTGTIVAPQALSHLYVTKTWAGAGLSLAMCIAFTEPFTVRESNASIEFDICIAGVVVPD